MKHIVFLVGEYKPNISPNGNIADRLMQELKNKYEITVITRQNDFELENECTIDGIKVIRIMDYNLSIHKFCTQRILNSKNVLQKKFYELFMFCKQVFFYIPRLCQRQSVSKYYMKKIQRRLVKLNAKRKIDILIPVSAPHEEVFAGVELKKKHSIDCTLLIYQLDRFANANSLYETNFGKNGKFNNNIALELEALEFCDCLFILPPLKQHYNEKIFEGFHQKIVVTEHPLVKKIEGLSENEVKNNDFVEILYAGSLDVKLRNPTYLFKLLNTDLLKQSNIKLKLYSFGNCQHIIDKYKKSLNETISDYGRVSSEKVGIAMGKCSILVTIGNNSDNEVPSKLFEYLSYCKPIIHLYYSENDAYLEYLKPYKYSLCIKMDDNFIEQNSKLFFDFCNMYHGSTISFDTVSEIYKECTPKFVVGQFTDYF